MSKIRNYFRNSSFLFADDSWARVLTGSDEGASLWYTIKYLIDKDINQKDIKVLKVIDVGGGSAQIAFSEN